MFQGSQTGTFRQQRLLIFDCFVEKNFQTCRGHLEPQHAGMSREIRRRCPGKEKWWATVNGRVYFSTPIKSIIGAAARLAWPKINPDKKSGHP